MNSKENVPLIVIDNAIDSITEITVATYNVEKLNSISTRYKHYRQLSKAP
jgi:hypothetical protein